MPIRECWPWAPCKRVGADGEPDPKQPARHAQTTRIAARFQGIARLHTLTVFGPRCLRCPSPSAERPLRCMDALRRAFCAAQQDANILADTKPDPTLPHISTRLALTRRALTLTRFQMARLIGTDMPTWGTYEAGLQRIPVDQALKAGQGEEMIWRLAGLTRCELTAQREVLPTSPRWPASPTP